MNEIGSTFGRLTVLSFVRRTKKFGAILHTVCACGNTRDVSIYYLRGKQVTECNACAKARRQRHKNAVFFR